MLDRRIIDEVKELWVVVVHGSIFYVKLDMMVKKKLWLDHRWNAEWLDNLTRLRTFIPDIGNRPPGMAKNSLGPDQPPPHRRRTFPLLLAQIWHGPYYGLLVWRRRINP